MTGDPQPLDPATYSPFNEYIAPLINHCNTHYLEISCPNPESRILIRYRKAGYLEVSENGEHWHILGSEEEIDALEVLLRECEVRFVKIGEIKQEIFERLLNRTSFSRTDEIIDAEADSVRILADAEVIP